MLQVSLHPASFSAAAEESAHNRRLFCHLKPPLLMFIQASAPQECGHRGLLRQPTLVSENAACELAAMGYHNVRDYAEGKQDWIDAGLPVESEHKH
jgi:hypothetical protein